MSEWKETTLADLCTDISYGYTESANEEKVGPKFLRITDIANGRLERETVPYCRISKTDFEKYKLHAGDIVIARTGATTGANYIVKESDPEGLVYASYLIRYKINSEVAFPYYIGHILKSSYWYEYVDAIAGGSAQPGANAKQLGSFEIKLPSLPEQHAIGSVLSSLDDKIDLLHRQNTTLEALAETLFRQWFVEEAGEDWEHVKVGDFVKTNVASINKSTSFETIEYLDTSSLTEGKIEGIQILPLNDAPSRARRLVKHNDILISTVRPNQKHYGMVKNPKENLVVSTGFCVISCEKIDPHFIYFLLTNDEMTEYLHAIAEGSTSTYPSLKPSDIGKVEFRLPSKDKLRKFSNISSSYWDKIEFNNYQITILEKLRDTLLPKLMSGEVEIQLDEIKKQPANIIPLKKKKKENPKFREAVLISAIVRAFYSPKIGNVSRQWYQKISYLHKRKMNDESAKMYELLEEYGKKAAGPYKREMRYQGPEGITLSNEYLEAVGKKALKPSKHIDQIDKYFYEHDYWNWKLFQNWTLPNLAYKSVKKLGVWATIDYCLLELKQNGKELTTEHVLQFISESKEWKHKTKQPEFSPENVEEAIQELLGMYKY